MNEITAQQKETAREYLRRAYEPRKGHWFTMEEMKAMVPTAHGIRALCTRGAEAVKDGEMVNRFRDGKPYKEWTWLQHAPEQFFFFELQAQFSAYFNDYSGVVTHVKQFLHGPADEIKVFKGTHEKPELLETVRLSPQELVGRGFCICDNCHGTGICGVVEGPCLMCSGTGWMKKVPS